MSRGRGNHNKKGNKKGRNQYNNYNALSSNGIVFHDEEDCDPFACPPGVHLDVIEDPFYARMPGLLPLFARRIKQGEDRTFTFPPNRKLDPTRRYVIRCFRVYQAMNETTKVPHLFTADTRIYFNSNNGHSLFEPKQPDLNKILDCTSYIGPGQNCIRFRHDSLADLYFVVEELVKLTVDQVVLRVSKQIAPLAECKAHIVDSFVKKSDDEVKETARKVSLTDPLTRDRLKIPCRSKSCTHVTCFDIRPWLMGVEKHKKYVCPLCQREIKVAHLVRDSYFDLILRTTDKNIVEVNFSRDGSWEPIIPPECSVDSAEEAEILGTVAIDKIVDSAFDEIGLGEDARVREREKADDDMDLCIAVTIANDNGASDQRRAVSMNNHANRDSNFRNSSNELRNGSNNVRLRDEYRERGLDRDWDRRNERVASNGRVQSGNFRGQLPSASNSSSDSLSTLGLLLSSDSSLRVPNSSLVPSVLPLIERTEARQLHNGRLEAHHRGGNNATIGGGIVQNFTTFSDCDVRAIVHRAILDTRENQNKEEASSTDESADDGDWAVFESMKASLSESLNNILALQPAGKRNTEAHHADFLRIFANSDPRHTPTLDSYFSSHSQLLNSLPLFEEEGPTLVDLLELQQKRHDTLLEMVKQQCNQRALALQLQQKNVANLEALAALLGLRADEMATVVQSIDASPEKPAADKLTLFHLRAVAGLDPEQPIVVHEADDANRDVPGLTAALQEIQEDDQRREAHYQAAMRELKLQSGGTIEQALASDGLGDELTQLRQQSEEMQLRWEEEEQREEARDILRRHQQAFPELYPQALSIGETSIPLPLPATSANPIPIVTEPLAPAPSDSMRPPLRVAWRKDETEFIPPRPTFVSPTTSLASVATPKSILKMNFSLPPIVRMVDDMNVDEPNQDAFNLQKLSNSRENARARFAETMRAKEQAATASANTLPQKEKTLPTLPILQATPLSPPPKTFTNADISKFPSLYRLPPPQQQQQQLPPDASPGKVSEAQSTPPKRTLNGKEVKPSKPPSTLAKTTPTTVATEKAKIPSQPNQPAITGSPTTKTSALSTVAQTPSTRMKFAASAKEKAIERQRPAATTQSLNCEIPMNNNNSISFVPKPALALTPISTTLATTTTQPSATLESPSIVIPKLPGTTFTPKESTKPTMGTSTAIEAAAIEAPRKLSLSEYLALQSTSGNTTDTEPTSVYDKLQAQMSSDDEKEKATTTAPEGKEDLAKRVEEARARLRASKGPKESETNNEATEEVRMERESKAASSLKNSNVQPSSNLKASVTAVARPDSATSPNLLQRDAPKDDEKVKDLLLKKQQERAKVALMKNALMNQKVRDPAELTEPLSNATHSAAPVPTPAPVPAKVPPSSSAPTTPTTTSTGHEAATTRSERMKRSVSHASEDEAPKPLPDVPIASKLLQPTAKAKQSPGSAKRVTSPKRDASPAPQASSAKKAKGTLQPTSESIAPSSPAAKVRQTLNSAVEPSPGMKSRATLNPKPRRGKRESLSMSDEEIKKAAENDKQLELIQQLMGIELQKQRQVLDQNNNENGAQPNSKEDSMEVEHLDPVTRKRGRNEIENKGEMEKEKAISVDTSDETESAESCDLLKMDDEPKATKKARKESQARVNANFHNETQPQDRDDDVILIGRSDKVLDLECKINIDEEKSVGAIKLENPDQGRGRPAIHQIHDLKAMLKLPRKK